MDKRQAVWQFVQRLRGRERAATARFIGRSLGLSEREVREIISDLRREGKPIASSVHKPYGFYLPRDTEEAQECLAHIYSRMREMGRMVRPLEAAFGRYLPGRQMMLELLGEKICQ